MKKMKNLVFLFTILSLSFTNCTPSDDEDVTTPPLATGEITGDVTANKTYLKGVYTLSGTVRVKSGAVLTFEAGSVITANVTNGADALLVENGGKLNIFGTAAEPVVFTEISKTP